MGATKKTVSDFSVRFDVVKKAKNDDEIRDYVVKEVRNLISIHKIGSSYKKVVFLYDPQMEIDRSVPDDIYKYVSVGAKTNILLVLVSPGGSIEPAYITSKICKEFSSKFVVVVPRQAKSAATLLALGADEIHMGVVSELGPIDPQIGGLPALGMESALEMIAELTSRYPGSSETFARYLSLSLGLKNLGFSKRVADSAADYAIRLLGEKTLGEKFDSRAVAKQLVYGYKDHGFVIDKEEAHKFLGNIIKEGMPEYNFGNEIYKMLEDIQILSNILRKKYISIKGGIEEGINFGDVPSK